MKKSRPVEPLFYQRQFPNLQPGSYPELGRVGVIYGGDSAERDISVLSGQRVLENLRSAGVNAVSLYVDLIDYSVVEKCRQSSVDIAFIMLHGAGGEDGELQALLQAEGIRYTGSDTQSSMLAMDKWESKQIWLRQKIPTAPAVLLQQSSDWQRLIDELGGNVVVKPVKQGSSIGINKAATADELCQAYEAAIPYSSEVMAEACIQGPELTFSILGRQVLPIVEIIPKQGFYDFDNKYVSGTTEYQCPANIDYELGRHLSELALKAFDLLGCRHWGRVDFMVGTDGHGYCLEVNTIPGMTAKSLVPIAALEANISAEQLVVDIVAMGLWSDSDATNLSRLEV